MMLPGMSRAISTSPIPSIQNSELELRIKRVDSLGERAVKMREANSHFCHCGKVNFLIISMCRTRSKETISGSRKLYGCPGQNGSSNRMTPVSSQVNKGSKK